MKIIYIILINFLFIGISNSAEEKCSINILKSNCVFQKMTDAMGDKVKGTVKNITTKSEKNSTNNGHVLNRNK